MSLATRSLITACAAIVKMTADARETLLLTILESNPSAVITAMKANGVTFGDEAKPAWNVVVSVRGGNKIGLIKMFREETGAGLAEAKEWSEGKPYCGREGGIIHKDLTKPEADRKALEITTRNCNGGFSVKVVRADAPYHYERWVPYGA
jgi:ribosomal protein L7/L12